MLAAVRRSAAARAAAAMDKAHRFSANIRRASGGAAGAAAACAPSHAFDREALLGDGNRRRCVAALQRMRPLRSGAASRACRKAAVLVPLCLVGDDVCLLYTLRAADLRHYRGQVAFPGGMQDEADGGSLEATALREAREELGLREGQARVWGAGPPVPTATRDAAVVPFVACVGPLDVAALSLCRREVEAAFVVPLERLCDPRYFRYTHFRNSYALPVFTAAEYRIWGLTAIITHMVLRALIPEVYPHHLPMAKHSLQT